LIYIYIYAYSFIYICIRISVFRILVSIYILYMYILSYILYMYILSYIGTTFCRSPVNHSLIRILIHSIPRHTSHTRHPSQTPRTAMDNTSTSQDVSISELVSNPVDTTPLVSECMASEEFDSKYIYQCVGKGCTNMTNGSQFCRSTFCDTENSAFITQQ